MESTERDILKEWDKGVQDGTVDKVTLSGVTIMTKKQNDINVNTDTDINVDVQRLRNKIKLIENDIGVLNDRFLLESLIKEVKAVIGES